MRSIKCKACRVVGFWICLRGPEIKQLTVFALFRWQDKLHSGDCDLDWFFVQININSVLYLFFKSPNLSFSSGHHLRALAWIAFPFNWFGRNDAICQPSKSVENQKCHRDSRLRMSFSTQSHKIDLYGSVANQPEKKDILPIVHSLKSYWTSSTLLRASRKRTALNSPYQITSNSFDLFQRVHLPFCRPHQQKTTRLSVVSLERT